jgi:hypothetical protein
MSKIGYPAEPSPQMAGSAFATTAAAVPAAVRRSRMRAVPRRATALIVGPVLVTAGFALHPVGGEDGSALIRTVAADPGRWAASHLIMVAGLLTLVAALPLVLDLGTARGRRIIQAGVIILSIGAVAMALDAVAHGYLAYVLAGRHDIGQGLSAAIATDAAHSTWASATSALAALFPLGVVVVAIGCARAGVHTAVVALLVVGVAGVGLVGAGPLTLLTTAPLVLGFAGLARAWTMATG